MDSTLRPRRLRHTSAVASTIAARETALGEDHPARSRPAPRLLDPEELSPRRRAAAARRRRRRAAKTWCAARTAACTCRAARASPRRAGSSAPPSTSGSTSDRSSTLPDEPRPAPSSPLLWDARAAPLPASFPEPFWRSLFFFNVYRLIVALLLLLIVAIWGNTLWFGSCDMTLFVVTDVAYVLFSIGCFALISARWHFNLLLTAAGGGRHRLHRGADVREQRHLERARACCCSPRSPARA